MIVNSIIKTGVCSKCKSVSQTNLYHEHNIITETHKGKFNLDQGILSRVELCKPCYDMRLAIEQVNYWKDHILEEEKRRNL